MGLHITAGGDYDDDDDDDFDDDDDERDRHHGHGRALVAPRCDDARTREGACANARARTPSMKVDLTEIIQIMTFENSRRDARLDRLTPGVFARVSLAQFIEDVNAPSWTASMREHRRAAQYEGSPRRSFNSSARLSTQLPDVRRSLEAVETLVEKRSRGDERGKRRSIS